MRRLAFLVSALFFLCVQVLAQNRTISGKITDVSGTPIPGATIQATGSGARTVSGPNGSFTISVPAGTRSLTVSSIGYATQTIDIGSSAEMNVAMSVAVVENEI